MTTTFNLHLQGLKSNMNSSDKRIGSFKNKYNIYVEFSVNELKYFLAFNQYFVMCSNERTNIRSQNIYKISKYKMH